MDGAVERREAVANALDIMVIKSDFFVINLWVSNGNGNMGGRA